MPRDTNMDEPANESPQTSNADTESTLGSHRDDPVGTFEREANLAQETHDPDFARTDFCWRTLSRYDHYNGTVNSAVGIVVSLNVFILGGVMVEHDVFLAAKWTVATPAVLMGLCAIVGLTCAVIAVLPDLRPSKPANSLIYFRSVARDWKHNECLEALISRDRHQAFADLAHQVRFLANVTNKKFKWLHRAYFSLAATLVLLALTFLGIGCQHVTIVGL